MKLHNVEIKKYILKLNAWDLSLIGKNTGQTVTQ